MTCDVTITFTAAVAGTRSAVIVFTDNASDSPQAVPLTGIGAPPAPAVTVAPTTGLSFSAQPVGSTSSARTVYLANSGTAARNVTNIAVGGGFTPTNTCGPNLAVGGSCAISVAFRPASVGSVNTAITITDNATGSLHKVPLSGTGVDFTFGAASGPPAAPPCWPDRLANYQLAFSTSQGVTGTAALACSGAPSQATNPASVSLNGTHVVNATVSVTTTSRSMLTPVNRVYPVAPGGHSPWQSGFWLMTLAIMLAMAGVASNRRRKLETQSSGPVRALAHVTPLRLGFVLVALLVAMLAMLSAPACGGGAGARADAARARLARRQVSIL